MNDVGWGWWIVMSVGWVAFWALLLYAVYLLVRGAGSPPEPPEPPEAVLRRRLAAGEISVEEYERLRDALEPREPAGVG